MNDRIIRNGRVLLDGKLKAADVAIVDGMISEVGVELSCPAREEMDAAGLLVLPGVFDAHVHFNEPGRTEWEGFATGSAALARGGGTSFTDMPLNAFPPTLDRESFELKRRAGEAASCLDFALWGGLVPGNVTELGALAECGVAGFKAFMVDSGIPDFESVPPAVLKAGMRRAAALGLPVAVHAEDPGLIARHTAAVLASGRRDARAFLDSRPISSEVEATRVAVELAGETGCALHVVHLSAPEALAVVHEGRAAGVDVTAESCPHHLLLNARDFCEQGAYAKCAPPLRDESVREELFGALLRGEIDTVGSDHSPAPPGMKTSDDMFANWGGIMGCQHGFLLLLDACDGDAALFWDRLSARPAERMGFGARKGVIAPGFDADLILVERGLPRPILERDLCYRHQTSPYVGRRLAHRVARSLLRGRDVPLEAKGCPSGGRFLFRDVV